LLVTRSLPVAGVDLGGTHCRCILAHGPDEILEEVRFATTTPDETLGLVAETFARWQMAAIGIGSFGPLDVSRGTIRGTPKPGWSETNLHAWFAGLGLPIAIDTDVNAAAQGERRWGAGQKLDQLVYITVGTGIGVGTLIDGRPVHGLGHSEAGHLRVPRQPGDDWPGMCAVHGDCVEGLAAGPAITARQKRGDRDPAVWESVIHALAMLAHNLVLTVAPRRMIIGGGVAGGNPWLPNQVRLSLLESLAGYPPSSAIANDDGFVCAPALGGRAGSLGAVALALDAIGTAK
jgi:fructokinase